MKTIVFVSLGGNSPHSETLIHQSFAEISALPGVEEMRCSPLYRTTPVSTIPQPDFLNAACCFATTLTAIEVLTALQRIEERLGKVKKAKDEPRPIDLDILLFGREEHHSPEMKIPHPHWKERLFVLIPLQDLINEVVLPSGEVLNLKGLIDNFDNVNNEVVSALCQHV